jgi:hypothetical protein
MKRLIELVKEDVLPIQHIFELSDELLKRAIDKSIQQNTTLSKRRAREFEKWMNNPRRIELQELANNSKEKQILMKAKKEHFDVAIEALKNKNRKVAAEHFETYFDDEWRKAILVQNVFGKIKINTGDIGFVRYSKYGSGGWYVGTYNFDLENFSRKRDNKTIYNETLGMGITFTLEGDDNELRNHDYRKEFDGYISFYFYKDGYFSAHLSMPYYAFPPSYKDDYEKMYKHLHDNLGIEMKESGDYGVFGKQDLNDSLSVSTVVHNNFYADLDKDSINDVLNKFVKVLQLIDPKCDIEIGISQREIQNSNFWIGAARQHWTKDTLAAKLTFCGKEHLLTSTHSHGIMGNSARISFDDITNGMSASKTDWGDGCWTGGDFSVNDEVCEILEKDRQK